MPSREGVNMVKEEFRSELTRLTSAMESMHSLTVDLSNTVRLLEDRERDVVTALEDLVDALQEPVGLSVPSKQNVEEPKRIALFEGDLVLVREHTGKEYTMQVGAIDEDGYVNLVSCINLNTEMKIIQINLASNNTILCHQEDYDIIAVVE